MLTAKTREGKTISLLGDIHQDEILRRSREENYYCPVCHSPVFIKTGTKRRWHFAHQNLSNCGQSESESEYHLLGKELLYEWLEKQHLRVRLEPYIPSIQQRPDLFASLENKTAIEFQCATISDKLFLQRTKSYISRNLTPVWILGGNRMQRTGKQTFRLQQMDWLALREPLHPSYGVYGIYFCPRSDQFAFISNIFPYSVTTVIAAVTFGKRAQFPWTVLLNGPRRSNGQDLLAQWFKVKQNWRSSPYRHRSPAVSYVNKMLRSKQTYINLIPAEAGIPLRSHYWIETPPFLWQAWLLLRFIVPLPLGQPISFQFVYKSFKQMVTKQVFTVRTLPHIRKSHYSFALMEYLLKLEKIGIVKKTGRWTFKKTKDVTFPRTVSEAVQLDDKVKSLLANSWKSII